MGEIRIKSENLFELVPEMWDASNWVDTYISTSSYFMYYKLSDQQRNRLKDIGIIAGTVYLHRDGQHTDNEILAITSEIKNTGVTTEERLLLNDGTVRNYTADVSDYDDIYLCIGYGYGYTPTNKQGLIRNLFSNYDIMLNSGSTALPYQPYFLNLPSHEKTSTGWKDIPTHTITATGWLGELTSQSPLEFRATGQSLLDWRVDGASGGVGDWDETEQKYKIPVTVRGENLYSGAWEQGFWAYSDGAAWDGDSKYVRTAKMLCKGNTKYEFVCSLPDGSKDYGFVFWDANGNFIGDTHSSDVQNTPVKYSAASPANARMMAVNIARYSDGERHPSDILSFDLHELHETNLYTTSQLMDGDSLDFATDQTSIPITQGDNTLTVDTAVQPKSVFVKFEG